MKLRTLQPRIKTVKASALQSLNINPAATPRQRGRKWVAIRARWLADNPLCAECKKEGRTTLATLLDHIKPLVDGGADADSNYQSLCYDHHEAKTAAEAKARGRAGQISGRW